MNHHLTYLLLVHACVAGTVAYLMRGTFSRRRLGTSHIFAIHGDSHPAAGAAVSEVGTMGGDWALFRRVFRRASISPMRTWMGFVTNTLQRGSQTRQQLREIMDRSLAPMAFVDLAACIRYANPALANLWPSHPLAGQSLFGLLAAAPITEVMRTVREKGAWSGEVLMRRADGSLMTANASATLVRYDNGRAEESLWIFADCSALTAQLRQSQKMEPIGRLAAGIAHDFNNLLTLIQGYSSLALAKLEVGQEFRMHFEEIRKAAACGSELTQQLLTISRPRAARREIVTLQAVISDCTGLLDQLAGDGYDLVFSYHDAGRVAVDPGELQQVLLNLVANARDASTQGGHITLAVDRAHLDEEFSRKHGGIAPSNYVALSVSDDGVGMDRATLTRIFDPFFTTKEPGKGTGLGLPMVLRIVQEHGGCISVDSEPGVGTTFRLYFPEVQESQPEAPGLALSCGRAE